MARIEFNALASTYDAGRGIAEQGLAAWRAALSPYLPPTGGLPILDLGCGTGLFSVLLADWFGCRVVAVDPAEGMLHEARAKHGHALVLYAHGDAENIPMDRDACGAAWLSTVIHHVPSLARCARELDRVLAPSGRILIRSSFPGRHEHISLFKYFPGAARVATTFPTVDDVVSAFSAVDFALEALESVPQSSAPSLADARARVALRADTTLRLITDEEFAEGLVRLDAAIEREQEPVPVVDHLDLLVLRRRPVGP